MASTSSDNQVDNTDGDRTEEESITHEDEPRQKTKYNSIPLAASIYIRFLYQDLNLRGKELLHHLRKKGFPEYAPRSILRHAKKPCFDDTPDGRKNNQGRPRKLGARYNRTVLKSLKKLRTEEKEFCSVQIQEESGITSDICSNRTVRRRLNEMGYGYYQSRKKGLLNENDLKKRLKFARHYLKFPAQFWQTGIAFYLDGVGWAHKSNPSEHAVTLRTRSWRKKCEGLTINCTAKGKREGDGGRMAKFMVAISYGKGVIKAIHYDGRINGEKFASIVRKNFPELFAKSANPHTSVFLQDGDTSQNAAPVKEALKEVCAEVFPIPAKSPDTNPIENIFHLCGKRIRREGRSLRITKESYEDFVKRCQKTLLDFPSSIIDRTIDTMPKRLRLIIENRGNRTKY